MRHLGAEIGARIRCSSSRRRPSAPRRAGPTSRAIWLRPPSAPITYLATICVLGARRCGRERGPSTWSSSWVSPRYSVSKRIREPRAAAWPTRIGSSSVWGRSQCVRGACQRVVGLPRRMGAPGAHAPDLITRQAGAEDGVPHQMLRGPAGLDVVLDPQVAEDLHRALVGDVGAGGVGRPAVLGDHDVLDAERGQRQRGGRSRRPCAHHEHVGVDRVAHRLAPLVGAKPFTGGAHRAIVTSAAAPPDNRRCADGLAAGSQAGNIAAEHA